MIALDAWAARWGIPAAAIAELAAIPAFEPIEPSRVVTSESGVQSLVRLEAARAGIHTWRNNVGAGKLENGSFLRWGLANESAAVNDRLKSADLIGIRKRLILQRHVGTYIGQFWSRECKPPGWIFKGTPREVAQLRWITLINSNGGDAAFANGEGTIL